MLLRKENQSLPVQSGKARDSTKTFAIYKIKSNYLILGNAADCRRVRSAARAASETPPGHPR
jgi:hypothetical protein